MNNKREHGALLALENIHRGVLGLSPWCRPAFRSRFQHKAATVKQHRPTSSPVRNIWHGRHAVSPDKQYFYIFPNERIKIAPVSISWFLKPLSKPYRRSKVKAFFQLGFHKRRRWGKRQSSSGLTMTRSMSSVDSLYVFTSTCGLMVRPLKFQALLIQGMSFFLCRYAMIHSSVEGSVLARNLLLIVSQPRSAASSGILYRTNNLFLSIKSVFRITKYVIISNIEQKHTRKSRKRTD